MSDLDLTDQYHFCPASETRGTFIYFSSRKCAFSLSFWIPEHKFIRESSSENLCVGCRSAVAMLLCWRVPKKIRAFPRKFTFCHAVVCYRFLHSAIVLAGVVRDLIGHSQGCSSGSSASKCYHGAVRDLASTSSLFCLLCLFLVAAWTVSVQPPLYLRSMVDQP